MGWGECFVCRGSGRADPERRQCNSITAGGRCLAPVDTANPAQLQGGSRPACCGEGMRGIIPCSLQVAVLRDGSATGSITSTYEKATSMAGQPPWHPTHTTSILRVPVPTFFAWQGLTCPPVRDGPSKSCWRSCQFNGAGTIPAS